MAAFYRACYSEHMSRPLVSAIVLNYRSPRDTHQCVTALLAQSMADKLEVLIVDNHSDDESIGWLRARWNGKPGVKIVETNRNIGYGRGNNAAFRHVEGEYVLIVNPDNTLPPDALQKMLDVLRTEKNAGIVGPGLVYSNGSFRPSARPFPSIADLFRKRLFGQKWQAAYDASMATKRHDVQPVDWLVGACLLLKSDFYTQLQGFDDRYFLFFEDIDLCRRCWNAGKRVLYAPNIHVLDRRQRLSGSNMLSLLTRKTTRIHAFSALQYFWKWKGAATPKAA